MTRLDGRGSTPRQGATKHYIRRCDAPLMSITEPLAIVAAGEARYSTAAATSSGVATRPSGLSAAPLPPLARECLGGHVRLGHARCDRTDGDAVRSERPRQRLAEGDYRGLAGAVGGLGGLTAEGPARGHVDDVAAAGADHVPDGTPGHVGGAHEVDGERVVPRALPLLVAGLDDRVRLEHARVVHEHGQAAEALGGRIDHPAHGRRIGEVGAHDT